MSTHTYQLDERLHQYLLDATVPEPDYLRDLRAETARLPDSRMQISPEQGQFMKLLAELVGARKAIEIGVFTGYSACCIAEALPPDGKLIACDTNDDWTRVARRYWTAAGLSDRIDLRLAPALDTLDELLTDPKNRGAFDYAFIDADKKNYANYYERILTLLRPGGIVLIDNALWSGRVADPEVKDDDTRAIRAINEHVRQDERVTGSLVPIGDGLLIARKR